jgi:hypothetical protein
MNWKLGLAAASMAAGMMAAATTASAEPPSYPLLCRGGGNMRIMVNHDVDGAGRPGATAMTIFFTPAGMAGGVAPPPPGHCTWMDRTLNGAEPANMWIRSPNIEFAFQVTGNGRVVNDGTGPRLNVEGAHISPEAQAWDSVVRAVMTGGLFTVQVYNESGRTMVITRVGP